MSERQLFLAGYVLFPGNHYVGAWRHPYSERDFNDRTLFEDVGRTLERAKFDMAFIPETLAFNPNFARYGLSNAIKHEPTQLAAVIAGVTRHLGIGVTLSASYDAPYHLARTLSSLDQFSGGRVAWNIIMSKGEATQANFPFVEELERAELYDRGDEVVESIVALWDSWAPNALVADVETGMFVDTDKVTTPDYRGKYVQVRGPLTLPRSPQGKPVLIQAGDSPRGRRFGGRWAELVFAIENNEADLRAKREDLRRLAAEAGRDPDSIKLIAAVQPIVGETTEIARARQRFLGELIDTDAAVAFLSQFVRTDLTGLDPGLQFTDAVAQRSTDAAAGVRLLDNLTALAAGNGETLGSELTLGEIARHFGASEFTPQLVGTGVEVADQMAHLFEVEAVDGYVLSPTHFPGAFDDVARAVVPHLQRRGIFRTDYADTTLRGNLLGRRYSPGGS
ncbi:NtaA/DmoA family FMN-dependent monooxygenase [Nocardia cerradoensis]|uniref:Pristinamycin IIA synthase subunit A n=1 Tax=Nocardia cerradoensis TaxID=85688 RepID=A0A231GW88_9NOCA|nr:NtaA/DmoA family FMN-dependent monooxygenase [Nocardia cerradoensis]NKY43763.1 NtaA/DmoA family FMN-dependent monooxygenase [Nocardia cerradoensis]OXR40884.1 Pristinamycin IIA synthase subunit A [Nocardia cerradoensis]